MNKTQLTEQLEILNGCDEILFDEERWTSGAMARNSHGHKVNLRDEAACSFCLSGAVARSAKLKSLLFEDAHKNLIILLNSKILNGSVTDFNDSHKFEDVKRLIRLVKLDLERKINDSTTIK